jgi:transglutaminase-like putative cysteine protease
MNVSEPTEESTMRSSRTLALPALLAALALVGCAAQSETVYDEEHYYAIEIKDKLCGYSTVGVAATEVDGRAVTLVDHRIVVMASLFGMGVNTDALTTSHIDPATGELFFSDTKVEQGNLEVGWTLHVEEGQARVVSTLSADEKIVPIPEGGLIEGPLDLTHLEEAFINGDLESETWEVFDVRDAAFQRTTYSRAGTETLELAGKTFDTVVLDRLNHVNGLKMRYWLDTATADVVQLEVPGDRRIYLAGPSVVKRIELADMDETITSPAGVEIADMQGISYMKVRLVAQPSGSWITPENLNVPGQSFEGTVVENRVEGVFEISHPRYDGTDAPPFPPDFGEDETLRRYLEPEDWIQSDDPVLARKAREITAGSRDSWEAAVRLSRWVADNIDYAIPGGATARRTFDMRAGECGAHSMLVAAFCRSVGIPARVVWGCMYVPNFGGAFGQHGWNEIYMGDAGWVPVDSTAYEADFVDSGHIRLGEFESAATAINMVETEVLDYAIGDEGRYGTASPAESFAKYERYVGGYKSDDTGRMVEAIVQNGTLVLDLPDPSPMLPIHDPDPAGVWTCKLTPKVFVLFDEAAGGKVTGMKLHELVRMQRTGTPEEIDDGVPAELRPYLGTYTLAPLNAEFEIRYKRGRIVLWNPLEKKTMPLEPPDADGRFAWEHGENALTFQRDAEGNIESLTVDAVTSFTKS